MIHEWQKVDRLAAALRARLPETPEVVLVLGSGLGEVAKRLEGSIAVPGVELPEYPVSKVVGHAGEVRAGRLGGRRVMILSGRVHLYEGHSVGTVVRPLRAAVSLGATHVALTNAAGGINPTFAPGDLMVIADHLNLTGTSALVGANDDTRGPRFPDMTEVYDADHRQLLRDSASALGMSLREGVYAGLLGPTYETPAEVKMLSLLGADAVGMSTVQEAIAVRHMGARIAAISCITNPAAGISKTPLNHAEVERAGGAASANLAELLVAFVKGMS